MRSYQHNSVVKRAWARVILGLVTSWEVLFLHPSFGSFWVLRSSTRMGDLLGSPRVAPLFLRLFGSFGVPFRLATCRPNGFSPPHRHRRRKIVDPVTQYTSRRNSATGIFPRFLPRGISHRLRTIRGNGRLFRRSSRNLWVETLG